MLADFMFFCNGGFFFEVKHFLLQVFAFCDIIAQIANKNKWEIFKLSLKGRHVIQISDLSVPEIDEICGLAEQIIVDPNSFKDVCRGKILAALFFEPSTRTRLSFEAAMLRLGGSVEGFADASYTSTTKGEILADTIRVVSSYADVIAIRSPKEGSRAFGERVFRLPDNQRGRWRTFSSHADSH